MHKTKLLLAACLGACAAIAFMASSGPMPSASAATYAAAPTVTRVAAPSPAQAGAQPLPSLAPVIKDAGPAVVNISTRGTQEMPANPFMDDPFFRRFFGVPQQPREREVSSLGSGVIVDAARGYIVTNHHVIENANEITVGLQDGRSFPAKLIGSDERTDIAVVKIEAKSLKAIPFGDSDALEVGDFVVAIGNPFGLDHTVTSGIVSGLGRRGLNEENYEDFIQTDAAINPGNSGGALIDLRGDLVGINTAIISRSGGNMGIGFAIPVNMARNVLQQIVEHGSVDRGVLGVVGSDVPPDLATTLGVKDKGGALVSSVAPGGGAEKAGVQAGDVIVAVDGKPVADMQELRNRIGLMRKGQKVKLDLIRDGKPLAVTASITSPEVTEVAAGSAPHPKLEGAAFAEIDERSPFYGRLKGVMVARVDPNSNAARRARLQPGDIITAVNRRPVANLAEFTRALKGIDESAVFALSLRRGNLSIFLTVP